MFLVFSKEKIFTYLISVLTVTLLFVGVANYQTKDQDIIEASSNTGKLLPIYKVKTEQKKVSYNADATTDDCVGQREL